MNMNWRLNPFTGIMNSIAISEEPHTIQYNSDWNAYGLQLNEAPELDNPSTVIIVEDETGGSTFTEVPRTQAPGAGQYRVDYDAATYYGTGRIEFNPADNGKNVLVSYYGTGSIVKNDYEFGTEHILGNLDVDGDVNVDGDITGDLIGDVTGNADTASHSTSSDGILETGADADILRWKIIQLGDWNMDANPTTGPEISHGLDISKIRLINIVIFPDSDSEDLNRQLNFTDTDGHTHGGLSYDDSIIYPFAKTGGVFDNSNYDMTSYNRGYVIIGYVE